MEIFYFLTAILSLLVETVFTSCGENATQRGRPHGFRVEKVQDGEHYDFLARLEWQGE